MKIYDISQKLNHQTPCWPGDTPFQYQLDCTKKESGIANVGRVTMSLHTGTHVDAPFHFNDDGEKIGEIPLNRFIGNALVVDMSNRKSIGADDVKGFDFSNISKLLIYTNAWNHDEFPNDIPYLRGDLAPYLSSKGIDLVGVDVPSVDSLESTELDAHHILYNYNIYILEGIMLDQVPPGSYELVALPLRIEDGDGSPVRAVLIKR